MIDGTPEPGVRGGEHFVPCPANMGHGRDGARGGGRDVRVGAGGAGLGPRSVHGDGGSRRRHASARLADHGEGFRTATGLALGHPGAHGRRPGGVPRRWPPPRCAETGKGRNTFRLGLGAVPPKKLTDLQVLAAGRRLDAAGDNTGSGDGRSGAAAQPAAPLPAGAIDPGKPGSYRTTTGEYALNSVKLPGFPTPIEMRAVVVAPKGATGKRPLALFLHGRHYTCYKPGTEDITGDWPCPTGLKSVPSYRGYLRDQQLLASQGYVTVSISANGINAQDADVEDAGAQARSSLVRLHLARWATWSAHPATAPAVVRNAPRADLSRVLLVGHSRGGEGVNRAAMDSLYPRPPPRTATAARSAGRSAAPSSSAPRSSARTRWPTSPRRRSCPAATVTSPTSRARSTSTAHAGSARAPPCTARSMSRAPTTTSSTPSGRPARPRRPRPTTSTTTPTSGTRCARRAPRPG